ncbi:MAG: MarC family integral membrane protein, partial [uncultured Sphingosinicella sp.]
DRAVRLGFRHLLRGDRPAGLRAHLREPHRGRHARAPARDGSSLGCDRVRHPALLRPVRRGPAARARRQPRRLSHRGRYHAVHDRARHGVRAPYATPREPRSGSQRHARDRGHFGFPHGDPHDRRAGLHRVDHAADGAQRRPGAVPGRAGRARLDSHADAGRTARGRPVDAFSRPEGGSDDHARAGRDPRCARGSVRHRRDHDGVFPAGL